MAFSFCGLFRTTVAIVPLRSVRTGSIASDKVVINPVIARACGSPSSPRRDICGVHDLSPFTLSDFNFDADQPT
jgi:hypothetical protein